MGAQQLPKVPGIVLQFGGIYGNNADKAARRNIFLIGFMGAGKSTIAAELKRQLQLELIEMDQLIEEQQGMPITEIFAKYGEDHFRKLETDMLVSFQDKTNTVVSAAAALWCGRRIRHI